MGVVLSKLGRGEGGYRAGRSAARPGCLGQERVRVGFGVPRYRRTIAYDGTGFCGWQKQFPHEDSVPTAPRLGEEERVWEEDAQTHEAAGPVAEAAGSTVDTRPRVELRTV